MDKSSLKLNMKIPVFILKLIITLAFVIIFLSRPIICTATDVTGQTAMAGNPRFMAVYMPSKPDSNHKNTKTILEAATAINSVFLKNGFIVLDKNFTQKLYQEIELAGMIDTDVDAVAGFALKYQADLLLLYDIQVSPKKSGKSKHFGGFNFVMTLKSVSPATGDIIATKTGRLYVQTAKTDVVNFDSIKVAATAHKISTAVSKSLIKDSKTFFSRAIRFDVWLNNFSQEEIYLFVDLLETLKDLENFDVRNQAAENFQLDILYKGKKFNLQRQLYKGLKKHDITFTTQQSKGNRLLLIRD